MCVLTEKEVMKKQKALRDSFVKNQNKQRGTKSGQPPIMKESYVFFEQLQFLVSYFGDRRQTVSNSNIQAIAELNVHKNAKQCESII